MGAPVVLLVAEDRAVLEALTGDLGRRFGVDYELLAEESSAAALRTLGQLATGSQQVALLFAGQQMTQLSGVEFLAAATRCTQRPNGSRIVGRQWEPRSHQLRDVLTRVAMPYRFHPHDSPAGRQLLEGAKRGYRLP